MEEVSPREKKSRQRLAHAIIQDKPLTSLKPSVVRLRPCWLHIRSSTLSLELTAVCCKTRSLSLLSGSEMVVIASVTVRRLTKALVGLRDVCFDRTARESARAHLLDAYLGRLGLFEADSNDAIGLEIVQDQVRDFAVFRTHVSYVFFDLENLGWILLKIGH